MTLEDHLRDQLHRQADDVVLPDRDPGRAVSRAHDRRRHRRVAVGATVVFALGAAVGIPQLAGGDDDGGGPVTAGLSDGAVLPRTGPLTFDWRSAPDGLSNVRSSFVTDDGTIYALSTAPGTRWQDHPDGDVPQALYRLEADGTWQPVPLGDERPDAIDATAAGDLLYAISTAPDGGDGYAPVLSTSGDGGDTWTATQVDGAAPPSDVIPWLKSSSYAIESDGDTTLAVVSTEYRPNQEEVFPQLREPGAYTRYQAEPRADGFALVEMPAVGTVEGTLQAAEEAATTARAEAAESWGAGGDQADAEVFTTAPTAPPTTAPPAAADPAPDGATTTTVPADPHSSAVVPGVVPSSGGDVVELVPWSDLGVSGIEALGATHQVFRSTGDGWEAVESTGLPVDVFGVDLTVAGGRFVASGSSLLGGGATAFTSADGATWTPVSAPEPWVVGVGSALVSLPYQGTVIHVSGDGGATWSDVDLAGFGLIPDSYVVGADAGPLGVALMVTPVGLDTGASLVVSGDLVDWTTTPIADVVGRDDVIGTKVVVGTDRIVVSATVGPDGDQGSVPASVTAVGTPVRPG